MFIILVIIVSLWMIERKTAGKRKKVKHDNLCT